MIPVTMLTGFLGSGKTTLLNQILKQNPDKKFGLIINEFGKEGIDSQLIESSDEEIVELSNGCICCVIRKDLITTAEKLLEKDIDYILIETSGLAEPLPVAQTFMLDTLDDRVAMDAVVTLVDAEQYQLAIEQYAVGKAQIQAADIIVINKINPESESNLPAIHDLIKRANGRATVVENRGDLNTKVLIETGKWTTTSLTEEEHRHEHEEVDEIIFQTTKNFAGAKLNEWVRSQIPPNVVRAKGFLNVEIFPGQSGSFLFQMIGASRMLRPYLPPAGKAPQTKLVLIGKDLDKEAILTALEGLLVDSARN